MAQVGKVVVASTVAASQFTGTLAQNAAAFLSLDLASFGVGQRVDAIIQAIQILSMENLSWEVWFFRTNAQDPADADVNRFTGYWAFGTTAVQIGGAGLFHYYIDGLSIPYQDEQQTSKLHLALINRSAAGKSAGANGAIRVQVTLAPTLGW